MGSEIQNSAKIWRKHTEKCQLRDEGFIIIKGAVPADIITRAKKLITAFLPEDERKLLVPGELATHPNIVNLFYAGDIKQILQNLMGPFPPVISCQIAAIPGHDAFDGSPGTHVDGGWSGRIPRTAAEIDPVAHRPKDAAHYFGKQDEKRGTNDGLLWMDPSRRISWVSYTALVGVCLSDQM